MGRERFLSCIPGAVALLGMAVTDAARAQDIPSPLVIDHSYADVRGWNIGVNKNFEGCWITATYQDQTTVWMGFSGEDRNAFVAFTNPKWKSIEDGKKYNLTVRAQGQRNWTGVYLGFSQPRAYGGDTGIFAGPLKEDFVGDIAAAGGLTLYLGQTRVSQLSMTGSAAAILKAIECHKEYLAGRFGRDDKNSPDTVRRNRSDDDDEAGATRQAAAPPATRYGSPSPRPRKVEIHSSCGDVDCVVVTGVGKEDDGPISTVKVSFLYFLKEDREVSLGGGESSLEYRAWCGSGELIQQGHDDASTDGDIEFKASVSGIADKGNEVPQAIWNYACKARMR